MPRYDGTCKMCGAPVEGHTEYCQSCRLERQRQRQREYEAQKKQAEKERMPLRPCADCGGLLIPAGSKKQLCDECRIEHKRIRDLHRVRGTARPSYGTVNEARRAVGLAPYHGTLPKGQRVDDINRAAVEEGLSYGKYIQKYGL